MPIAEVNGQRLAYEDTSNGVQAIVFSHGLMMDRTMFVPQVHALADRYRCISWDERGHGETGPVKDAFTYWDSADDVGALLDSLGVERAVLAGMSQGGFLSMRCALAHPERVRALILMDTQAGVEDPQRVPGYRAMLDSWISDGLSDEIASVIEGLILGPDWPGAPTWRERWRAMPREGLPVIFETLVQRDDLTGRLSEIDVPALVIHGEADASISVELAQQLTDGLPQAELAVIPGAGHAANLTHPDEVNVHVERFLAGLE